MVDSLEATFKSKISEGSKLLVPYVTAGYPSDWSLLIDGCAEAGADALEIGFPFSDPVMDGPTIQESSNLALDAGITPYEIFSSLRNVQYRLPLIAMTYYNICFRMGLDRFANELKLANISATIIPDLPLEESGPWLSIAEKNMLESIQLAAPTSDISRLERIVNASKGFIYGVGLLGVTGERDDLSKSALDIARRLKDLTDKPVLIGVGISTPEQAVEVCEVADGVIIGSAFIRKILDSNSIENGLEFISDVRNALDA